MPVTASRLRSRIAMVLAYAAVREGWAQSNPATWLGGLPAVLPSPRAIHQVKPMRAAPFRTLPGIVARLDDTRMCDRALLWTLTTVARTGEVFQATLEQVDTWNRIWHLPRGTTKNGEPRRIPLHPKMVPWLHRPGPLSPGLGRSAMLNRLKELSPGVTVHGIRSAFADWCSDVAEAQEELVEQALGPPYPPERHLARLRPLRPPGEAPALMEKWGTDFLLGKAPESKPLPAGGQSLRAPCTSSLRREEWLKWASLSIGGARWARHPEHEQPEVGALAINNLAQRIEAASRGALPEHLQQELAEADQAERTRLFKQLGSGWETSSAGMEYFRRKAEATSAISRAELSDLIGQTQAMQANRQNRVGFQI